ncbi:MarR family transcriptional regulator [Arthrobacter sp. zg-Y20]|uniref:MarR family winged helix-turn-helix transcriptional regulator n=1 Tax=unclassified Arthrobacter TaxID=235627 RepID=UPI001D13BD02|nr:MULTISPECIES: MarR family transcriptional regulator [unclassified Arthrobacter]MCC3275321.1 MarR family transcriptional regulator [Arthrobacter sp. zg-Y20]MDK1315479.1 MarR family transcriptional regulator [Arthrobacter sp. zg.Y20]WIB05895.1 MarR family transcriptional regulator [Arthrobacter sp. zg-Y20]
MTDHVGSVLQQWAAERPDLDVSPMAVVGRLSRTARRFDGELAETFAAHGLDAPSFDVLATLRRSGPPYTLSPRELTASSMVTSAAIAQRLNRLEAQGFVRRSPNAADGRGKQVALTDAGRAAVDAALPDHVATEHRLLAPLDEDERKTLAGLLAKLDT